MDGAAAAALPQRAPIQPSSSFGLRVCVHTRPGPEKSNTRPSPLLNILTRPPPRLADRHLHRLLVGDHVAGVDRDVLPFLEVPHLERAVAGEHDLSGALGPQDEPTLARRTCS